jgi:tryptophan synthase alpha chain
MNKLTDLFKTKTGNILSIYFTAGYPNLDDTTILLNALERAGVDMIEIGIPFSDPLADGPVIQHSSEVALRNGMNLSLLFKQLSAADRLPPTLLMGYVNPILQYGVENFCKDAQACGISGVIIPDLPMDVYLERYKSIFGKYDLINVFLITPQTSDERIRLIDQNSNGFIYVVSSASTTGMKNGNTPEQINYFKRIKAMKLKNPLMIGFGISDSDSFNTACEFAKGAIIGSAFINGFKVHGSGFKVKDFINNIRN